MRLARVAVNVPLNRSFHYIVPDDMPAERLLRAEVNFGGRDMPAFILEITDSEAVKDEIEGITLKPLKKLIDKIPIINEELLDIAEWMSRFYLSAFGETLFSITPSAKKGRPLYHEFSFTGKLANLNAEQNQAYEAVHKEMGKAETFLLRGITGSGKTEVYKHLVRDCLDRGKSAILLIPEIALTPQTLERFYESFGEDVALYHSKLSAGERLGEWIRALKGEARVVIGPRSAIFAPVKELGLIIIDEEHETSYKSGQSPRYHARQIAFYRSKKSSAPLLLGSATPQVESYYHALNGNFHLLSVDNRYGGSVIPEVEIVDLKEGKDKSVISGELMARMMDTLSRKRQSLLFLNRRGFAPGLLCKSCGYRFICPNCDIAVTYHKRDRNLVCHHCGYSIPVPLRCPDCDSVELKEVGSGTERLEELLENSFPKARILRMDFDTTRRKQSIAEIIDLMKSGKADILVGTQMIAKGHDIPHIDVVGAILPDITLSLPDFRSAERAFILLTQVIGRAGRRSHPGTAVIQTYMPDHYAIQTAALQDYVAFYEIEIEKRREFDYPPFTRLGRIVIRGKDKKILESFVKELKAPLKERGKRDSGTKVYGPVSCPLEKLNNQYRYHIIFKSKNIHEIRELFSYVKEFFKGTSYVSKLYLEMDFDPVNLM